MVQTVKNLPAMQETRVQSLGWEDALEKGMATHSSILAWKIPRIDHGVAKSQTDWATNTFTLFHFIWKGFRNFIQVKRRHQETKHLVLCQGQSYLANTQPFQHSVSQEYALVLPAILTGLFEGLPIVGQAQLWYRQAVSELMAFIIQEAYEETSEIPFHHQKKE